MDGRIESQSWCHYRGQVRAPRHVPGNCPTIASISNVSRAATGTRTATTNRTVPCSSSFPHAVTTSWPMRSVAKKQRLAMDVVAFAAARLRPKPRSGPRRRRVPPVPSNPLGPRRLNAGSLAHAFLRRLRCRTSPCPKATVPIARTLRSSRRSTTLNCGRRLEVPADLEWDRLPDFHAAVLAAHHPVRLRDSTAWSLEQGVAASPG